MVVKAGLMRGQMIDNFNRTIDYLRVSLTENCNFNCIYCKPDPIHKPLDREDLIRFINIFANLGIEKIRFSGGEPLVRKDIVQIIKETKKINSIKSISITTNGYLLEENLVDLVNAGLTSVNISIDATSEELFKTITNHKRVDVVIASIKKAIDLGLEVKLNAVLLKKYWIQQVDQLYQLAKENGVPLRFIELMPIGIAKNIEGVSSDLVIPYLEKKYKKAESSFIKGNGPARYLNIDGVDLGFIDALSHNFCSSCNRLRLLSTGEVKLCLYQEPSLDLRKIMKFNDAEISALLKKIIKDKNEHHNLNDKAMELSMASIGG